MKDNVIDFRSLQGKKKNAAQQAKSAQAEMNELMARLSALPERTRMLIESRFTYLMMFTIVSARTAEMLKEEGFDPDAFEPDEDVMEYFLSNGPFYLEGEDESLWNGPMFDCRREGALYRVASTIGMDEKGFDLTLDLLKQEEGQDQWLFYSDGAWVEGPSDDYFDYLDAVRNGWFDGDEDDLDFGPPENVDDLDLSAAVIRALRNAGIETVDQLCEKTAADLLAVKGIGRRSLEAIVNELSCYDLELEE